MAGRHRVDPACADRHMIHRMLLLGVAGGGLAYTLHALHEPVLTEVLRLQLAALPALDLGGRKTNSQGAVSVVPTTSGPAGMRLDAVNPFGWFAVSPGCDWKWVRLIIRMASSERPPYLMRRADTQAA